MLKQTRARAPSRREGSSRSGSQSHLSPTTRRSPEGARAVERAVPPVRTSNRRALGRFDAPQTSPPCRRHALQHLHLDHGQSHGRRGCARCADKMGPARAGGVYISLSWIPCKRRPCACCPVHSKDDGGPRGQAIERAAQALARVRVMFRLWKGPVITGVLEVVVFASGDCHQHLVQRELLGVMGRVPRSGDNAHAQASSQCSLRSLRR